MDGQRRFRRSLRLLRRTAAASVMRSNPARFWRAIARGGAVVLLLASVGYGLLDGGHFEPADQSRLGLDDAIASRTGFAASDIEISGLTFHSVDDVLSIIGVKPGASLLNFDMTDAKRDLEARSWVASAEVQRVYPNRLKVSLTERIPFAIWRTKDGFSVIDRAGVAMTEVDFSRMKHLPLVTGDGANTEASTLIDALSSVPDVMLKLKGSARVGNRRWTLYMDNGVKVLLPERNIERALMLVSQLDAGQRILSKAIASLDLRIDNQIVVSTLPGGLEQAALANEIVQEN